MGEARRNGCRKSQEKGGKEKGKGNEAGRLGRKPKRKEEGLYRFEKEAAGKGQEDPLCLQGKGKGGGETTMPSPSN